ncbi:hypothetical protein AKJ16_DCAP26428 [Drosera capensis]
MEMSLWFFYELSPNNKKEIEDDIIDVLEQIQFIYQTKAQYTKPINPASNGQNGRSHRRKP